MPTVYKNAQLQGTASLSTYGTLYSSSADSTAVISSIVITNTSSAAKQYRVAITGSEGTPAAANWVVYDATIAGNDAVALTLGITLGNTQFIRVSSTDNTLTFSAYISETT
jgi:hypothetical protein